MKQEQQAIDAQFEKKRKGAETAQKMYVFLPFDPATKDLNKETKRHSFR